MARNFKINYHHSNGNLHLKPNGSLDGSSAWELINLIHSLYNGHGNVFVDTRELMEILPFGGHILKNHLDNRVIPLKKLFFKGEKGHDIAPSGCRVLIPSNFSGCKCKNKCKNCGHHHGAPHLKNLKAEGHEC
jgi:hypothetical protein